MPYLGDGEGGGLGHLALGAEEGVALHAPVPVSRDEREHVVERRVSRAVGDPAKASLVCPGN